MLNPLLVPTPLVAEHERSPVRLEQPRSERLRRLAVLCHLGVWLLGWLGIRMAALAGRLLAWLPAPMRPRSDGRAAAGARQLRQTLERLGFLAVKVGQLLSLRTDLFSAELCAELSRLQYSTIGFPVEIAVAIVERELGGPLDSFFSRFDPLPIAAASIAQVHRARLRREDVEVVVKVMRPGAPRIFAKDLALLRALVRWLGLIPWLGFLQLGEFLWEVEQIVREEVDFRYELANIQRFRRSVRRHRIYVPRPFAGYSKRRVLVMEAIDGVLMSDYIAVHQADPERAAVWLSDNEVDPQKAARRLLLSFLRQLFEDNLFHGDLHPGNVMLLRRSRVALIDLGSIGSSEAQMVRRYAATLMALASWEFQKAAELNLSFTPELPLIDLVAVREELVRALRAWAMRTRVTTLPYHLRSLSNGFAEVIRIMARRGIGTSWGLLRIDRSLTTVDASLRVLTPRLDYLKLFRRYFREREERLLRRLLRPAMVRHTIAAAENAVSEFKLWIAPYLRQLYRAFDGNALSSLGAFAFRLASLACFAAGLLLLAAYLHQRWGFLPAAGGPAGVTAQGRQITLSLWAAIDRVPAASHGVAIAALLTVFCLALSLWRLASKLLVRDMVLGWGRRGAG
ncbi:MAG TPA: AarF/ABC1/UbiB kinase family protein [Thermoanaerobaculia bacterium]|jgi:ubiquinone biosynthesis protein|nr:AarF/ABC1/UbiB kinase family protein [Thermoanaerobaculia bacterium]